MSIKTCSLQTMTYPDPQHCVINPDIPFCGQLPRSLEPGTLLWIQGAIPHSSQQFKLDLCTGKGTQADIPLHINPRFNKKVVVRNTYSDFHWGQEEKYPNLMPFRPGDDFEMMIMIEQDCFKIAVNKRHFVHYNHRLSYSNISHYQIDGGVRIKAIEIIRPGQDVTDSSQGKTMVGPILPLDRKFQPVYNPEIPFTYPLDGLKPGMKIYISGHPHQDNFYRFQIDLTTFANRGSKDTALHINPRYDQRIIVCNSFINNQWGNEQRQNCQPFESGVFFDMMIFVEANNFNIALNNQHLMYFSHRVMPISRINGLVISGHVNISCVSIE